MIKRYVLYIIATLITTVILIVVCINFGTMKKFIRILEQNSQKVPISREIAEPPITCENLKCNYGIEDFNSIVESINRVLEFFQHFTTELVLDATVGTRALQGQLQLILRNSTLPTEIRMQLEHLLRNATNISDNIMTHFVDTMMENDQSQAGRDRLRQNLYWIESGSLWEMPAVGDWQASDDLDLKRYDVIDDNSVVFNDVQFSDVCIGAVFDNCNVPEDCFELFLRKRHSDYVIAHAMLFLLFAKKKQCFDDRGYMEKISKLGHPNDIMASFCAKIFLEMQTIDMGGFNVHYRDLFCEHVLVCSMAGFRQFLHPAWLRTILSWQSNSFHGCFELPKHDQSKTFEEIYGIEKENKRVKRYDNVIETGSQSCSTHFTGVALGGIGMHLRYLIESCSQTLFEVADST